MSFIAKDNSSEIERPDPIEAGVHLATCYGVFDIGTQEYVYNGKEASSRKVIFVFEVPDARIEIEKDGKKEDLPRAISETFTVSLSKKSNLRPALESWRGKPFTESELQGFDLFSVAGAPCMLNINHDVTKNGYPYAFIQNIVPLVKGMEKPKHENPLVTFSFEESNTWPIIFPEGMPEWIQKKAKESVEYRKIESASNMGAAKNNEIEQEGGESEEGDNPF